MPSGFRSGSRLLLALIVLVAGSLSIRADVASSQSAEVQLQLGSLLFSEGRYQDSLAAYRNAAKSATPDLMTRARSGVVSSALRVAEFDEALVQAEILIHDSPRNPEVRALYGDALWASGLFEQAEVEYVAALASTPD